jgi:lysozyme family protein
MATKFDKAIKVVLAHEGGYVNDPNDLGGETNFGISKRSYPNVDIKNLTREQAVEIYRRDWWERYKHERIEDIDVATKVFDLAVNMGAVPAHRLLQQAINFTEGKSLAVDGIIGPATLSAVNQADPQQLVQTLRFMAARRYYELAKARPANRGFLLGWLNRAYF